MKGVEDKGREAADDEAEDGRAAGAAVEFEDEEEEEVVTVDDGFDADAAAPISVRVWLAIFAGLWRSVSQSRQRD